MVPRYSTGRAAIYCVVTQIHVLGVLDDRRQVGDVVIRAIPKLPHAVIAPASDGVIICEYSARVTFAVYQVHHLLVRLVQIRFLRRPRVGGRPRSAADRQIDNARGQSRVVRAF